MKKQPAKYNYFFKGGYVQLGRTIRDSFCKLGASIADAFVDFTDYLGEAISAIIDTFTGILALDMSFGDFFDAIKNVVLAGFFFGKLACVTTITTFLTVLLSFIHTVILLVVMFFAYVIFSILAFSDFLYRQIKRISSKCPNTNCQNSFPLPVYPCPSCNVPHTELKPSRYGIWKRKCNCGASMPTTFFNGREKLKAVCPFCGTNIKDGGKHVDICIPVVGGANSGKTCFVSMAVQKIEEVAPSLGLEFVYSPLQGDDYAENCQYLNDGHTPPKTSDMRLKYYQFYLNPPKSSVNNLFSICDVAGEVYSDSEKIGKQIAYRFANAFLLVIDPLSIAEYRQSVSSKIDPNKYGYSADSIDEVLGMLITTLENMFSIGAKDMLKTDVAIAFTKCDIPGLYEEIGPEAVAKRMAEKPELDKYKAQNEICIEFLEKYGEANFINTLRSKFKFAQFFCCSALGHNEDGTHFESMGVEEPVLWLIDKTSASIDLKKVPAQAESKK